MAGRGSGSCLRLLPWQRLSALDDRGVDVLGELRHDLVDLVPDLLGGDIDILLQPEPDDDLGDALGRD